MPPCHGGDRRFESGRARQTKKITLVVVFLVCWFERFKPTIASEVSKIARFDGVKKECKHLLLTHFCGRVTDQIERKRYPVGPYYANLKRPKVLC